jgi:hypothetical protein
VVNLPRDVSPGTGARRSLLADLLLAIAIALLTIQLAAGIGVVGFLAVLTILVLALWIVVEATIHKLLRRKVRRSELGRASRSLN